MSTHDIQLLPGSWLRLAFWMEQLGGAGTELGWKIFAHLCQDHSEEGRNQGVEVYDPLEYVAETAAPLEIPFFDHEFVLAAARIAELEELERKEIARTWLPPADEYAHVHQELHDAAYGKPWHCWHCGWTGPYNELCGTGGELSCAECGDDKVKQTPRPGWDLETMTPSDDVANYLPEVQP